jgi:release factor glutamine methyltransferase
MTVEKIYKEFVDKLVGTYESREADNIADWVFETITGSKRLERSSNKGIILSDDIYERLNNALQRLLRNEPVQYVLGEAYFYKRRFIVNKHVLIPRPETEELVEEIKKKELKIKQELKILDIGTGSGCIAISIKKELPGAEVTAIDVSEEALKVARDNATSLDAEVIFRQKDFLNEYSWQDLPSYDIIVSNPPYIPIMEKEMLSRNVTEHEPPIALFVWDNDPFIFYKMIARFSKGHLDPNGKIYVEVHENFAKNVKDIFFENRFTDVKVKVDIYGKERMITASK